MRSDRLISFFSFTEDTIEHGHTFLTGARNLSKDIEIFTEAQLVQLETVLTNVNNWKEERQLEQSKTPDYETPKLTVAELIEKVNVLRGQINNLVNIAKVAKQKPPVKKQPEKPKEEANKTSETKDDEPKNENRNKDDENRANAEETLEKLNQTGADQIDPSKVEDRDHSEL